jgi:RNA polymerase sigma-70 factor, ECF subfamily
MSEVSIPTSIQQAREGFLTLVAELRPDLHRYCSRLVGSVIDGEDLVQETLAKAFYTFGLYQDPLPLRPWLFRVARNAAFDFLRRYEHRFVDRPGDLDGLASYEEVDPLLVRSSLRQFLQLPPSQRSAVILKDVLDYPLEEVAEMMETSVSAVKSLLMGGRASLKSLSAEGAAEKILDAKERERLSQYVSLFNAKNWDSLRALITEECRLDLVAKTARRGKEIHGYFVRYQAEPETRLALGAVEGKPALLVFTQKEQVRPSYFILLSWGEDALSLIRDFRYVPYIVHDAEIEVY